MDTNDNPYAQKHYRFGDNSLTYLKSFLATMTTEPCDHRPPLPAIDIAPRKPITQPRQLSYLEIEAEENEARERLARGDRVWAVVDQIARSTNVSTPLSELTPSTSIPLPASECEPSDALVEMLQVNNEFIRRMNETWGADMPVVYVWPVPKDAQTAGGDEPVVERQVYQAAQGAIPIDDLAWARIAAEQEAAGACWGDGAGLFGRNEALHNLLRSKSPWVVEPPTTGDVG